MSDGDSGREVKGKCSLSQHGDGLFPLHDSGMGLFGHENGNMEIAVGPPVPVSSNPAVGELRLLGLWAAPKCHHWQNSDGGRASTGRLPTTERERGGRGKRPRGIEIPHRRQETQEKRTIMMGRKDVPGQSATRC